MSTKQPSSKIPLEESLKIIFTEVFQQVSQRRGKPEIAVTFYPFVGLNNTIRIRNQQVYVRVSDLLREAPLAVHRALAHILVGKLFKRRPSVEYETLYYQYAYQPQMLRASELARRHRGRKQLQGAAGRIYDLERIFVYLNRKYFDNDLAQPTLSWSPRRTKRILGHHDAVHNTIVISRSLDRASVPRYVVEYVMYHEMLHIKHKPRLVNGRQRFHTAAFRDEEKRFAQYEAAIQWLECSSPRRW